jgi:hypothetical protein
VRVKVFSRHDFTVASLKRASYYHRLKVMACHLSQPPVGFTPADDA